LSVGKENVQDISKPQFKTCIKNAIISDVNFSRNVYSNTPEKPRQFKEPLSPPTPGTPETPQTPQSLPRDRSKPIYDHTPLPPSQPHIEEIENLETLPGSQNEQDLNYESSNKNYKKTSFVHKTKLGQIGQVQYTSPKPCRGILLFHVLHIYTPIKHNDNHMNKFHLNKTKDTYILYTFK
jgi:hypothetical protein